MVFLILCVLLQWVNSSIIAWLTGWLRLEERWDNQSVRGTATDFTTRSLHSPGALHHCFWIHCVQTAWLLRWYIYCFLPLHLGYLSLSQRLYFSVLPTNNTLIIPASINCAHGDWYSCTTQHHCSPKTKNDTPVSHTLGPHDVYLYYIILSA